MSLQEPSNEFIETDITIHIFSVSATLVGVCLTVIGLFHISKRISNMQTYGQEFLSVNALLFLLSCVFAYFALIKRKHKRHHLFEKTAERVFFVALSFMVMICGLIVYEFI
jgi:putative copper export protein